MAHVVTDGQSFVETAAPSALGRSPRARTASTPDATAGAEAVASGVEAVRARGDLPRAEGAAVSTNDCPSVTTCAIDDQPRGAAQWRPHRLSGYAIGPGGLGAGSPPEALQARLSAGALPDS